MGTLDSELLTYAVAESAVAARATARREPVGALSDTVLRPTYVKAGRATTKYAFDERRVGTQYEQRTAEQALRGLRDDL
jgi:hypothetical protein